MVRSEHAKVKFVWSMGRIITLSGSVGSRHPSNAGTSCSEKKYSHICQRNKKFQHKIWNIFIFLN